MRTVYVVQKVRKMILNEGLANHRVIKETFYLMGNPKNLWTGIGQKKPIFILLLKTDAINKNVILIMANLTDLIVDCDNRYIFSLKKLGFLGTFISMSLIRAMNC